MVKERFLGLVRIGFRMEVMINKKVRKMGHTLGGVSHRFLIRTTRLIRAQFQLIVFW